MSTWEQIACLIALRSEFNAVAPNRDKGADGSIGDSSHTSSSDHTPDEDSDVLRNRDADSKNEVHALDIDSSGPWPGTGTQKERFHRLIMRIIDGERAKWRSATDKCRLNYVIWDRKIYDKDNDFQPVAYGGPDPHTNHAHFSGRYETSCENDTRPWGVQEDEMTPEDLTKIAALITASEARIKADLAARVDDFLSVKIGDAANKDRTAGDVLRDLAKLRGYLVGDTADMVNAAIPLSAPIARILEHADTDPTPPIVITKEVVRAAMIDIITGKGATE